MKVKSSKDLITKGLERHVICQLGMFESHPNSVSNYQILKMSNFVLAENAIFSKKKDL